MPFANSSVIAFTWDVVPRDDVAVPWTDDGYRLLYTVYSNTWLPHMESMMRERRLQANRLFSAVRVRMVKVGELRLMDPSLLCFLNVNTRRELEATARLARRIG